MKAQTAVTTSDAINDLSDRSALIFASRGDTPSGRDVFELLDLSRGEISLNLLRGNTHGTNLLANPAVPPTILTWLDAHLR